MSKQSNIEEAGLLPEWPCIRQWSGSQMADPCARLGIVVSRFNKELTTLLAENAIKSLLTHGVEQQNISVVWVPGAYEIPFAASELIRQTGVNAVIALGVVIQGETQHAQLVNEHVARALGELSIRERLPVIYEVISAPSFEHARARCEGGERSRGWYAGLAALEMFSLMRDLAAGRP